MLFCDFCQPIRPLYGLDSDAGAFYGLEVGFKMRWGTRVLPAAF